MAITFCNSNKYRSVAHADCHRIYHTHYGLADRQPKLNATLGHTDCHRHAPVAHADSSAQRDANAHTQTFCYPVGHVAAFSDADSDTSAADLYISAANWAIVTARTMIWRNWNIISCAYDCLT